MVVCCRQAQVSDGCTGFGCLPGRVCACSGFSPDTERIRDAYFVDSRQSGIPPDLLKTIFPLDPRASPAHLYLRSKDRNAFLQVVQSVASRSQYSGQDAVKAFSGRRMPIRIFLDLCYMTETPPPISVKACVCPGQARIVSRFREPHCLGGAGRRSRPPCSQRRESSA